MIIAGIDCGAHGALAFLDTEHDALRIEDMPIFTIKSGKRKRSDLDGHRVAEILRGVMPGHTFIERPSHSHVSKKGKDGESNRAPAFGAASLMQNFGELRGILRAIGLPLTEVGPQVWKRAMAVPADKDSARKRASELMPANAFWWPLKKHDGRAESALIALYGLQHLNGIARGK